LPSPLIKPREFPTTIPFQPLQSEAHSLLSTAVSVISSETQAVANAAATAISDIEADLPKNLSLGTKKFCIGYNNRTQSCQSLPLNVSNILPTNIANFLDSEFNFVDPLEGIMAKVTPINIEGCLILGTTLVFIVTSGLIGIFFNFLHVFSTLLKVGVGLLCVLCFALFFIPYFTLHSVQSKLMGLDSILGLKEGNVGQLSMGALVCTGLMMLTSTVLSILI
jgi:hypothetical protein